MSSDAAAVGSWQAADAPIDLHEAAANTRRASGKKAKKGKAPAAAAASGSGKKKKSSASSVASSKKSKASTAKSGKSKGKAAKGGAKKKGGPKSSRASSAGKKSVKGGKKKSAKGGAKKKGGSSKASSVSSRGRRGTGKVGGKKRQLSLALALANMMEDEEGMRRAVIAEEELEEAAFHPIYNVLVMEIVRAQVQQLNARQQILNSTFDALRAEGFPLGDGLDGAGGSGGASMDAMFDRLREKMQSEAVVEAQRLREENTSLRERLEERTLEGEKRVAELEGLRNTMARRLARSEVEGEHLRAEAQSVLQNATMDVDRMKKELAHRIDASTAALRTPKYGTALRSLQDLATEVQSEIQDHRDRISRLIASIGARDTFRKDGSDTMHSNFPPAYRAQLRALEKDQLVNILDVLSFQEGVVGTVGKALYVLSEREHKTAVV